MMEHRGLHKLEDYFLNLNQRAEKAVYFYRLNGYNEEIGTFIQKYYEAARVSGVIIEGKIPNPNEKNLEYYEEMMGLSFQLSMGFLTASLKKWLPRMNDDQRGQVAASMYDTLDEMRKGGKTENILKNAYIKFMCWLYYKFERIVNRLGQDKLPKILYEGEISSYELKLITILSHAGCDVVLLQYRGDGAYQALDKDSRHSMAYPMTGLTAFPEAFSIDSMRGKMEQQAKAQRIYGAPPKLSNCTNAWIEGTGLADILKPESGRGTDPNLFYNCFYRITGAEDKQTYLYDLYQFYLHMKGDKRRMVIVEHQIEKPVMDEISQIKRGTYGSFEQMAAGLSENIQYTANLDLQKVMRKAFLDVMSMEREKPDMNLNKLTNKAVYLLCWLRRYQQGLFSGWIPPQISCFIYFGGCQNENESMLLQMVARLPADVLILAPDRAKPCLLKDELLYELSYENSLEAEKFPSDNSEIQMGTMAYHAERELDSLMYQDSGMYRNQQCKKATTIVLKTMYEEIALLWDQELKYRPNFSVVDGLVTIPAILAKVSGVKEEQVSKYWADIKELKTEDTYFIRQAPFLQAGDENPIRQYATEFFKNGKVQKAKIKEHKAYQYGMLRNEVQDHMLDKLQLLIDQKSIKGTFENGAEYTIISTALNLNKEFVRMIQRFDFTKKNPKLIYIDTTESMISLEDSILAAYLSLVGFDVLFFVPTGYQTVESHFSKKMIEEHQIGEYIYDLTPPDFGTVSLGGRTSWVDRIFKRG